VGRVSGPGGPTCGGCVHQICTATKHKSMSQGSQHKLPQQEAISHLKGAVVHCKKGLVVLTTGWLVTLVADKLRR